MDIIEEADDLTIAYMAGAADQKNHMENDPEYLLGALMKLATKIEISTDEYQNYKRKLYEIEELLYASIDREK